MKAFTLLGLGTLLVASAVSCGGVTSLGENEAGSTQGDGTDDGMTTTDPGTDPNGMGTDPGMGGIDPGTGTDPGMGGGIDPNVGACMSSADCPVLLGPCEICPDGTAACPGAECINGQCESFYTSCGGMGPNCQSDSDCGVLGAPCEMCADGTVSCPQTWCNMGICEGVYQSCGGGYDPCAGKACGDSCSICDPNDPSCAQIELLLLCDAYGQCGPGVPECNSMGGQCTSAMDCPYSLAPCQVCPDGSTACPSTDCIMGTCVTEFQTCVDPNPQPGACMTDAECPQLDGPCQICPDGTSACPGSYCLNGQCILSFPACGGGGMYDPCANKSCGDACTLCPPDDMNCFETLELKACDMYGACSSAPVACAMP